MTPQDFARKWAAGSAADALGERAGAQAHFIDLCRLLGVEEPGDPERYCFERGLTNTGSAAGLVLDHTSWVETAPDTIAAAVHARDAFSMTT